MKVGRKTIEVPHRRYQCFGRDRDRRGRVSTEVSLHLDAHLVPSPTSTLKAVFPIVVQENASN